MLIHYKLPGKLVKSKQITTSESIDSYAIRRRERRGNSKVAVRLYLIRGERDC